jgi:hypothetical protein
LFACYDKVTNFIDLETAARQFQDAINFTYDENGPSTVRRNKGIHPGGIRTLRRGGGKFAGYLMRQRSQGIGLTRKEL